MMDLARYIQWLKNDEVVVMPTETVYGLAASIESEPAILKIFEIKQRPLSNPLIVHIQSVNDFSKYALTVPDVVYQLATAFCPGPISFVLPAVSALSPLLLGGQTTVALRIPQHPIALQLIRELGTPIAAPSANRYKGLSATTANAVALAMPELKDRIIDGGRCAAGVESTIIGFEKNQPIIYRMGSITNEQIEAVLEKKIAYKGHAAGLPQAPGMQLRHYAPQTPMVVTHDITAILEKLSPARLAVVSFQHPVSHPA
ncbi:MAG: threonylcarbamoyl-AMP synthase, partial [Sediminibacterium sp.]|nr:threonylcarbamoyl-AMP synthase [Sediminibacterium sp.]